jgi:hypothetical protein
MYPAFNDQGTELAFGETGRIGEECENLEDKRNYL